MRVSGHNAFGSIYTAKRKRTAVQMRRNLLNTICRSSRAAKNRKRNNAAAHAGREMSGGYLEIEGNTKEFTGASYIGEWRGMTGGQILVRGNAGKQCGECLTGGRIHVMGNCDILAGIHMTKGIIEIEGDVNRWPGGQMKNGNIIIHGFLGRLLEGFVLDGIVGHFYGFCFIYSKIRPL